MPFHFHVALFCCYCFAILYLRQRIGMEVVPIGFWGGWRCCILAQTAGAAAPPRHNSTTATHVAISMSRILCTLWDSILSVTMIASVNSDPTPWGNGCIFWNGLGQYIDRRENAMPATSYSFRRVIDILTIELLVTDLTFIYYRRLRPCNNRCSPCLPTSRIGRS